MNRAMGLLGLAAALGLAASARADIINVNVWGGYTTVSMADLNGNAQRIKQSFTNATVTEMHGGWIVGADAGYALLPFLLVGPRVAYIQAAQAGAKGTSGSSSYSFTEDASLIPVELGVRALVNLPLSGLAFTGGAYGGWAFAGGRTNINNGTTSGDELWQGDAPVGELALGLRYKIAPMLKLGLETGYRWAYVGTVTAAADQPLYGVKQGDVRKVNNKNLPYDFSGVNALVSLSLGF